MKISTLAVFSFLVFLAACTKNQIQNIHLKGDLIAKQIVTAGYNLPSGYNSPEIVWYIAPSAEGEWEKLPGIYTDQIVLLTSYVGKYLKFEISAQPVDEGEKIIGSYISTRPVEYKGNPDTDWFHDAGFGIMFHYLSSNIVPDGTAKEWNDAVDSFDAENFAQKANEAGAGFVMVTLGQNSGYYCSPNAAFDSVVGVKPGELCSFRDLPGDLIKALGKYNIPVILYLPSNPPVNNRLVSEKFRYPLGKDSATSQYNQPILESMIREWSLRYGTGAKGWWFDGLYEWNAIRSTRMDMSLNHNISTHTLAAKAGNHHSIVTYNYGFGKIHVNTPYCDYSSGEKQTIDEIPSSRWVEDGVQWFLFTYLGEQWGGKGQQFKTADLTMKAKQIVDNGGVLCLDVVVDAKGNILPHQFEQIKEVGKALSHH
ncbi:MAG: alpha-L-fucosidase [Bacteroidales bacterium]|nr:alpha-L-fucosidase [Bacteroidales bacterium]